MTVALGDGDTLAVPDAMPVEHGRSTERRGEPDSGQRRSLGDED